VADEVEALDEADRGRGLALAEGRRGDRRDQDVLAARVRPLEALDRREADLCLDRAVQLQLVVANPEVAGNLGDRARRRGTGDLEVGQNRGRAGCRHRGVSVVM
jgi:hypothetical protein